LKLWGIQSATAPPIGLANKKGNMRFHKHFTVCLQQHKSLMTFKTLLYKCYARRGQI